MQTSLINMSINDRQQRLGANIVSEDVTNDTHWAILRKQATKAANKKLKTKNKNFENTKLQQAKIQRDFIQKSNTIAIKKK